jgi:hypothetical protein
MNSVLYEGAALIAPRLLLNFRKYEICRVQWGERAQECASIKQTRIAVPVGTGER